MTDDVPVGEPSILGWPDDEPQLRLDYRRFSYAGKFVMSNTGKAVIRAADGAALGDDSDDEWDDNVLAAVAFNADRTDPGRLWLRYVTVRGDYRGEGLGPRLCAVVAERAATRNYDRVRIAVNNPFAYEALYRAGFAFTGEETGLAELTLERPTEHPADRPAATYREGLGQYAGRNLSDAEQEFLRRKLNDGPPALVERG